MSDNGPVQINYRWKSVELHPGEAYVFPSAISKSMREEWCRPAIYRWAVYSPKAELRAAYFGEAENLIKRITQYLRPEQSQRTNMRLHLHFHSYRENKWVVKLDSLDFQPFRVNSIAVAPSGLHDCNLRRMLEAFLVLDFVSSGNAAHCSMMNLKMNPVERRMRRAIRAISEITSDAPPGGPDSCPPPSAWRP